MEKENLAAFQPSAKGKLRKAVAGVVLSFAASVAVAQSTVGGLQGVVDSGAVVKVTNPDNGITRDVTADSVGRYNFTSLAPGHYIVTVIKGSETVKTGEVDVEAGVSTTLNLASAKVLDKVVVRSLATRPVDFTTAESSTTFSAKRIQEIPVARDQNAVALLAPSTTTADSRLGGISFGGSSSSENSYYVNGFNVTNLFRGLDRSDVPFEAIQSEQIITGGYGPEYSFSTGGVVSVQTKRGSNKWVVGGSSYWSPRALSDNRPNSYCKQGDITLSAACRDGILFEDNARESDSSITGNVFVSGPLIKDRLFVYVLGQQQIDRFDRTSTKLVNQETKNSKRSPFFLGKVDWNIDENNHFEFTSFRDRTTTGTDVSRVAYLPTSATAQRSEVRNYLGNIESETGGLNSIAQLTSRLTDDLTGTVLYGRSKYQRGNSAVNQFGQNQVYNGGLNSPVPGCATVADGTGGLNSPPITGCTFSGSLIAKGSEDQKDNLRFDLEYKLPFDVLGKHVFKGGFEKTDFGTKYGEAFEGGAQYVYYERLDTDTNDPGQYGNQYVQVINFRTGAEVNVHQTGIYLEDNWNLTDRFLLSVGVREEGFENENDKGEVYVKQESIYQPRLGATFDVFGDKKTKIFATFGRYALPIATNVAIRGAAASVYSFQDYYFDSVQAGTGVPQGLRPTPELTSSDGTGAYYSQPFFINGENGQSPNSQSVASNDLKPYTQNEFTAGVQSEILDQTNVGVRFIYRKLNKAIDDTCDLRPLYAFAQRNGYAVAGDFTTFYNDFTQNNPGCFLFNPGSPLDLSVDLDGDGRLDRANLSAADVGEPKAKRKYYAVELTGEKAWSNKYYAQLSYTWSHSFGNAEGQVNSDNGQTDTGTTVAFDFPEFARGSYGDLPNDRRHSVKAYGGVKVIPEVTLGTNLIYQTGRPKSCFGRDPVDVSGGIGYGSAYFYCAGQQGARGDEGRQDSLFQLDLSAIYTPTYVKGLQLSANVFNVLGDDATLRTEERSVSASGAARQGYGATTSYQTPRYFRFGLRYEY